MKKAKKQIEKGEKKKVQTKNNKEKKKRKRGKKKEKKEKKKKGGRKKKEKMGYWRSGRLRQSGGERRQPGGIGRWRRASGEGLVIEVVLAGRAECEWLAFVC